MIEGQREARPFTDLPFKGGEVRALVDSGASRSLLRREAYLDICKQQSRIPLIRKTAPLFSVSGAKLTTLGETEMEMHPGGAWPWTIVEGISRARQQ